MSRVGKMPKLYELWDGDTGNLVGAYESEKDALAAVHDTVRRHGRAAASTLALAVEDEGGEGGMLASGASLIERAEAVARLSPAGIGGIEQVPDSRERGERPSGEAFGETMAADSRDDRDERRGVGEDRGLAATTRDRESVGERTTPGC